jgi:hypothetical protein
MSFANEAQSLSVAAAFSRSNFQGLHPGGKHYLLIVHRNERVQVIWHEYVVPHPRAMRGPL